MAGYPDAATLVEAVRGFLEGVEGKLDGRDAFHAKVAGNVLAIVARELRAGEVAAAPGDLDALIAATVAQLEIDNPRYSTLARLKGIEGS